jgi:outer membrane lipoprotein-sorting protein
MPCRWLGAQENADAILENMAKRLSEMASGKGDVKSISGDLVISMEGDVGGKREQVKLEGKLIAAHQGVNIELLGKGGKMVLVAGREKGWLYLEPFKSYAIISRKAPEGIKGLTNVEELGKSLRIQILKAEAKKEGYEGRNAYRVTITPKEEDVGQITIVVLDKIWIPVSLRFSNEDFGSTFSVELRKIRINEAIPAGRFEFRPPAGAREVSGEEMANLLLGMIPGMAGLSESGDRR